MENKNEKTSHRKKLIKLCKEMIKNMKEDFNLEHTAEYYQERLDSIVNKPRQEHKFKKGLAP